MSTDEAELQPDGDVTRRSASRGRRVTIVVAAIVAGIVVLNLLAIGLDRAVGGSQPGGANGSSYATAPAGLAAFSTLVAQYGHTVVRFNQRIADATLPPNATVFVLEPSSLTGADSDALLEFVDEGGRLVVGGGAPFYLRNLSDDPPTWSPDGATTWTGVDPSFGVTTIAAVGTGSWSTAGAGHALVDSGARSGTDVATASLLTEQAVGRGDILFLADASPLENQLLPAADNAAFALALAGDASRPVVFPEGVHGYGTSRGFAAIPVRWKIALALVGLAALAFVWSRARRFGPPDQLARDLPPARAEYVQALSISLERAHDRGGALAPAQRWTRARIAARSGLAPGADDAAIAHAARALGCTDDEIAALLAPVTNDAGVLAFGRVIARVGGHDGRTQ